MTYFEEEQYFIRRAIIDSEVSPTESYDLEVGANGIIKVESYTEYPTSIYYSDYTTYAEKAIDNQAFEYENVEELTTNHIIFPEPELNVMDFYDHSIFYSILEEGGLEDEADELWEQLISEGEFYYRFHDVSDSIFHEVERLLTPYYDKLYISNQDLKDKKLLDMVKDNQPEDINHLTVTGFLDYLSSSEDYAEYLTYGITDTDLHAVVQNWKNDGVVGYELSEFIVADADLSSRMSSNVFASGTIDKVIAQLSEQAYESITMVNDKVFWIE